MAMMAAAAPAYEEHLRRVHSTGDLPSPVPSIRPSPHHSLRRSEGTVRLQRPEPLLLPLRIRGASDSIHSLDVGAAYVAQHLDGPNLPRQDSARRQQRRNEDTPTLFDRLLMACGLSGEDAKSRREFISYLWGIGFATAQVHIPSVPVSFNHLTVYRLSTLPSSPFWHTPLIMKVRQNLVSPNGMHATGHWECGIPSG